MDDYKFDVFLSYKRHKRIMPWVEEVHEYISYWLTQELDGVPPKIFFDKNKIETGANWPEELCGAANKSRCMVGVWSPEYFRSKWCLAEWQSFHQRQELISGNSYRAILPMRFHDGETFPEDARNIQSLDVSKYNSISPAFWKTEKVVYLEELIQQLCRDIASSIRSSPKYDPTWPSPDVNPESLARVGLMRL